VKPTSDSLIAISTQYFDKTEDWGRKAKAWYYRGRINQDLGDALHAQDYYLKALQDENQINDYILIGRIYSSIGMLYTYQNVYEKALPYQRKALDRFALMQDSVGISYVLRDIGRTFTALEKKDSAIAYYEQALLVCSSRNKPLVYGELASLYIDKGEYLKSYKYIQKVLSSPSKKVL
ncbi:tetratricopeptide repeat protein, partial [Phocaeicola vulgatus]